MTELSQRVTIVGAGISGLACAYRLGQLGIATVVLESSNQGGGVINTESRDGFLFESGPQSFTGTAPLLALIRELDLDSELQISDPAAPRFIVRGQRLHKLPMSPPALLTSSFLGAGSRWRIASEPLRRGRPPANEESVAAFVRRKFGSEILEYLVSPFVSGVYAGDPEQLSLRAAFPQLEQWEREHGSVWRGAIRSRSKGGKKDPRPQLCSFRGGVATLPRRMAKNLGSSLRTGLAAVSLSRSQRPDEHLLDLEILDTGHRETNSSAAVVIATPAFTAANLIGAMSPKLAAALSSIAYAPVTVVAAGYKRAQILDPLYGFGFLVPRKEQIRTLGTVWNSSLFPGRAPDGAVTMTSFIGGATDLEIIQHSDQGILQIVQQDNSRLLGITGAPLATQIWKYPRALPQYNLGHGSVVDSIREAERAIPGVFLAGNYLDGPSLGKCVENGFQAAEKVAAFLGEARKPPRGLA
jgi:protoporphyrinogen/coproporphyrinogen III oxidase